MKTTLEIPDVVFRRAKAKAAERGIPFRQFVTDAVEEKLRAKPGDGGRPWLLLITLFPELVLWLPSALMG